MKLFITLLIALFSISAAYSQKETENNKNLNLLKNKIEKIMNNNYFPNNYISEYLNNNNEFVDTVYAYSHDYGNIRYSYNYENGILTENAERIKDTGFVPYYRHIFEYNSNEKKFIFTYMEAEDGQLVYTKQKTYLYDTNDRIILILENGIKDGNLTNLYRRETKYNALGFIQSYKVETWYEDKWVLIITIESIFDQVKKQRIETTILYFVEGNILHKSRTTYYYDESWKNVLSDLFERFQDSVMVVVGRSFSKYNEQGNMTKYLAQKIVDSQWTDTYRETISYNSFGKIILEFDENFKDNQWEPFAMDSIIYGDEGKLAEYHQFYWNYSRKSVYKCLYSYNSDGNIAQLTCLQLGSFDSLWYNFDGDFFEVYNDYNYFNYRGYSIELKYKKNTHTADNIENNSMLTINPNPADEFINITYNLNKQEQFYLSIYDILGELKYSEKVLFPNSLNFNKEINVGSFPDGIYFISIMNGSTKLTRKFIKKNK